MIGKRYLWAAVWSFSLLAGTACKDRLFDNPFDPDAEVGAYEIVSTIHIGGIVPVDLAFSGDALWVVDAAGRILALNPTNGSMIRELESDITPSGICYDGADLWLTEKNSTRIVKINIINGETLRWLNLTRGQFTAIDFASGTFFICDRLSNSILQVNAETGTLERSIPHPGFSLDGVTFDGASLWTVDASQIKLFRLDPAGAVTHVYQTPGRAPSALASAAGFIWCADGSGKIFRLRFP